MSSNQSPPSNQPAQESGRRRRRFGRFVRWAIAGIFVSIFLVVIGGWILLASVNRPFVRDRIQGFLQQQLGVAVRYYGLSVSLFSGIQVEKIVVGMPSSFSAHAPDALVAEQIDFQVEFWPMIRGELWIPRASVKSIKGVVVERGEESSLTELVASWAEEEAQAQDIQGSTPFSHLFVSPGVFVDNLQIEEITWEHIAFDGAGSRSRTFISGLSLVGYVRGEETLAASLRLGATPSGGIQIVVDKPGEFPRTAVLTGGLEVSTPKQRTVFVRAHLDIVQQNIFERAAMDRLLDLELAFLFQPSLRRTEVRVPKFSLADDAVTTSLVGEIRDAEDGSLHGVVDATGEVHLAQWMVPIVGLELAQARGNYAVHRLEFGSDGIIGGTATLQASADRIAMGKGDEYLAIEKPSVEFTGLPGEAGRGDLSVRIAAQKVFGQHAAAALRGSLTALEIEMGSKDVSLLGNSVAKGQGGTELRIAIGKMDAAIGKDQLALTEMAFRGHSAQGLRAIVQGQGVSAVAELPIKIVDVRTGDGRTFHADRLRVTLGLTQVRVAPSKPFSLAGSIDSTIEAQVFTATSPPQSIRLEGVDWTARAATDDGTANVTVSGSLGNISYGKRAAFSLPEFRFGVNKSQSQYSVDIRSALTSVRVKGQRTPGTWIARGEAVLDSQGPKVDATFALKGARGVDVQVRVHSDWRDAAIVYDVQVSAKNLGPVGQLIRQASSSMAPINWSKAEVTVAGKGKLSGLVVRGKNGSLQRWSDNPLRFMHGQQSWRATCKTVSYSTNTFSMVVPQAVATLSSSHQHGKTAATLDLQVPQLRWEGEIGKATVEGFRQHVDASWAWSQTRPKVTVAAKTAIRRVQQPWIAGYSVADVAVATDVYSADFQSAEIRALRFVNPGGGTFVEAKGVLEQSTDERSRLEHRGGAIPEREAFWLEGTISQDFAQLDFSSGTSTAVSAKQNKAQGQLTSQFRLESGDLLSARLEATVHARAISVSIPGIVQIDALDGVIPIVEDIVLLETGIALVSAGNPNPLAWTRFLDVQPFLNAEDYLRAQRVELFGQVFSPVAGNVRIQHSTVGIHQLQAGYRQGVVSGQLHAQLTGDNRHVLFRGNVTGLRPKGSREILDANATLKFFPSTLALDGKVQIVRIGKAHLSQLLDVIDPYRENVQVNRIRFGLQFGYPKFLRLQLQDGLLDAKVELGGLARVVRIDDIIAVPIAPVMELYVAPLFDSGEGHGSR